MTNINESAREGNRNGMNEKENIAAEKMKTKVDFINVELCKKKLN